MGDENRHIEFARFVHRRFPKIERVLVIADGKGGLARKLANKGYRCRVIENSPRFDGKQHPLIQYEKGFFNAEQNDVGDAQLIVGMHPDEGTGEIILASQKYKIPFAVVPCCALGRYSDGIGFLQYVKWIKKLKLISNPTEFNLKISGRNLVLFRR